MSTIVRAQFAPALMTVEVAAYYLSISVRELASLRSHGILTPVGKSRPLTYRKDDLDRYIETLPEITDLRSRG